MDSKAYDTWRKQENPNEMTEAEVDAEYAAHQEALEEFADRILEDVPQHDFTGFVKALEKKLPEHVEFRRNQKEQRNRFSGAMDKYRHLGYSAASFAAFADILGNTDNRRAKFPTRIKKGDAL